MILARTGTTTSESAPVAVSGALAFTSISVGSFHTCGVTTTGAAYCWGSTNFGQLGLGHLPGTHVETPMPVLGGLSFVAVSSDDKHTCGITTDSAAYCWGQGAYGRLGHGFTSTAVFPVPVSGGFSFSSVSAGGNHTCGLTIATTAYCWGLNDAGELGDGTNTARTVPVLVLGP